MLTESQQSSKASTFKPVKQGWVLKKGGSSLFVQWKVKYLNLCVDNSRPTPRYTLQIFDERDPSKAPKHEIQLEEARIDASPNVTIYKKGAAPFTLMTRTRKFHLACYTKLEKEDWIDAIQKAKVAMKKPHERRGRTRTLSANMNTQFNGRSVSRQTSLYAIDDESEFDFDDAKSVYSVATDDAESIITRTSARSRSHSRAGSFVGTPKSHSKSLQQIDSEDDMDRLSVVSSNVETLSFCSEPVLTPYELTIMGNENTVKGSRNKTAAQKERAALLRRRVPEAKTAETSIVMESWNERYQRLLLKKAVTEDAMLQKDVQIVEIIGEFQETATAFAKSVIDDYHIFDTNHSASLVAEYLQTNGNGDHLFRKDGIVYHFACNYDGSTAKDIENAMKQTSADFRSLDSCSRAMSYLSNQGLPVLNCLLMVLIDYKGFRIIAQADVEAGQMKVEHDLQPDEVRVHEGALEAMTVLGRQLNLKVHGVQVNDDRRVWVPLASTVEVHSNTLTQVKKRDLYLSNLQDLFPVDYYEPEEESKCRGVPKSFSLYNSSQHTSSYKSIQSTGRDDLDLTKRFRPEFIQEYRTALCSDALTPTSGSTIQERQENDSEALLAARFLRETWIPAFVKNLDSSHTRPFDSPSLTGEMHRNGINMRYLGLIHRLSTLPFIQTLVATEMVSRVCKHAFFNRMRSSILHFKTVGAQKIDDEIKSYAATMFSLFLGVGEKSYRFFEECIRPSLQDRFQFNMTFKQFALVHRPSLFISLQYHCSISFDDTIVSNSDFDSKGFFLTTFKEFIPKPKRILSLPPSASKSMRSSHIKEDERLAYLLARHFKGMGNTARLGKSNASSTALCQIAAHYNQSGRYEEARLYSQAAVSTASKNHMLCGYAHAQLVFALAGLQACVTGGPDPTILSLYSQGLSVIEWHAGPDHPFSIVLHDRLSTIYYLAKETQKALEFHLKSLYVVEKAYGRNHPMTALYLTRAGYLRLQLKQIDEASQKLDAALEIYASLQADPVLISEVQYHYSECLYEKGDFDASFQLAQRCRKIRERMLGLNDIRTIDACRQTSKVALAPYHQQQGGVLTPAMRVAYREAIACHEKVFRYLKTIMATNAAASMSLNSSMNRGNGGHTRVQGIMRKDISRQGHAESGVEPTQTLIGTQGSSYPIVGPLIRSPIASSPSLSKSLLHVLTKEIVSMKIMLLDSPKHREYVRVQRLRRAKMMTSPSQEDVSSERMMGSVGLDINEARQVILRMSAVSPSVYLDGLFQRIDDHDEYALEELGVVLALTEYDAVVGVTAP